MKAGKHTPGPWRLEVGTAAHRKGSPLCVQECIEKGRKPIRIEHDTEEEAALMGWPGVTELHVMECDWADDIIAANGTHVVCNGHDYDDLGYFGIEDGKLIAAAPDHALFASALVAGLVRWENDTQEVCVDGLRYSVSLDEFGIPELHDLLRDAISKARGTK